MVDDKEIGEGLFEAENRNLKKKEIGKKDQTCCGQIVTEEKDLATLGPNTTFTTQGLWLKKPHTFHYLKKSSYTKLYKILTIS